MLSHGSPSFPEAEQGLDSGAWLELGLGLGLGSGLMHRVPYGGKRRDETRLPSRESGEAYIIIVKTRVRVSARFGVGFRARARVTMPRGVNVPGLSGREVI